MDPRHQRIAALAAAALLFRVALALGIAPTAGGSAVLGCNKTCSGQTPNISIPFPFGFSSGCPIQLNCTPDGTVLIGEFPVQEINSHNGSISVNVSARCDRPFRTIDQLYGRNFAPKSNNEVFLGNCTRTSPCDKHLPTCSMSLGNVSCYTGKETGSEFLSFGKLSEMKCGIFTSSTSEWLSNSLYDETMLLDWWVSGEDYTTVVGLVMVPLSIVVWILLHVCFCCCPQRRKLQEDVDTLMRCHGSSLPRRYEYRELKKLTRSFSEKLGEGGYGVVYKGKLRKNDRLVAVKILKDSKGNGEEFINEVASISRTAHLNIVELLGFCYDGKKRALLYDYMPNGSLDKFLPKSINQGSPNCPLEWKVLHRIAIGIARGLEYLHQGCNTRILHFDIKPQNILLDDNFTPKISDFGLAKLCQGRESIVSMIGMRGTIGYIAPEVFSRNFGDVSHKSDVYSYGMLLFEVIGGKDRTGVEASKSSEMYFPDWVYKHLQSGKPLWMSEINSPEDEEIARKMMIVSLWCIQTHPSDRPSMSMVIDMLGRSSELLGMPPVPLSIPQRGLALNGGTTTLMSSEQ
ncbi:hypothetical protein MLD38_034676 [Melastoma candidum]|uniref:Uncharacterized protein n=1 Tax=Melastoma candidum TaxID=119954 RepID=A0ACB9MB83_9MYRT|nr:hypothetical protein MLD38_034676 [Melastoma candidum]